MAKLPFSKLGIKVNSDVNTFNWNEYSVEIKSYLPVEEKMTLIATIVNLSTDDLGYYNPIKVKMNIALETLYAYSNLAFTAKMKEDTNKLYDMIISSGLFEKFVECMSPEEWNYINEVVYEVIDNVYGYKNSVLGLLDAVLNDYNNLDFDATAIQEKLADPDNIALLKDIMTKLG